MGLSLADFCMLSPEEFEACHKAYYEREQAHMRDSWERMRLQSTILVQPQCRQKIDAKKLLPFEWDKKKPALQSQVSRDDAKARFDKLMDRKKNASTD